MNHRCCTIVELRQYTLHPGRRDTLIDLFDRHFVDGQEQTGMHIVGQFRDLGDPDRFVWLRGFESMAARKQALSAFYGGPVWRQHREIANATMIDSDNVLLLEPLVLGRDYSDRAGPRAAVHVGGRSQAVVEQVICERRPDSAPGTLRAIYHDAIGPALMKLDAPLLASFTTLHEPNDFPALPVRDTDALVWMLRFFDRPAYDVYRHAGERSPEWAVAWAQVRAVAAGAPDVRLLRPTTRSQVQ